MSLQRRLMLVIITLLILLLAANSMVNVYNARVSFYQQLQVHARDTATSLGFTISQAALAKDTVQVSSMIDVIFDSGYYRRIVYRDLEGNDIVLRQTEPVVSNVPRWFTRLVHLPVASGEAAVSSGWYQLGVLQVDSHPDFVYKNLWRSFKEQLWLFLFTVVFCYGLLGIGLKYILRPLKRVEEQAAAITERQFVVQQNIPSIPELRSVVTAMNRMVTKVQAMFAQQLSMNDRLLTQTRTDSLTGLPNRRDFDDQVAVYLASGSAASAGVLLLVHVSDLEAVNRDSGRAAGDAYVQAIAEQIEVELGGYVNSLCSRHRGTDFAIFIPSITREESQQLPKQLNARLQELEWDDKALSIHIGAVFAERLNTLSDDRDASQKLALQSLMVAADGALSVAIESTDTGIHWQALAGAQADQALNTVQDWLAWLDDALTLDTLNFYYQPVWYIMHGHKELLFNELLTHVHHQGEDYTAGYFIPMATRLQKVAQLDSLVTQKLLIEQQNLPEHLCVNLSIAAIVDDDFVTQLKTDLSHAPSLAKRLTFELPAASLRFYEAAVRDFAQMIQALGATFSLHHFGRDTANFSYLQSLPLDYLKIDRSFTHDIVRDQDAQFFVQSLVAIAKSCDVMILAEGVETQAQWEKLLALGIQGGQGYWLGKPQVEPVIA